VDRHQFDIRPGVGDRRARLLELDPLARIAIRFPES
jgi:hypothetical protein